jgi:hypothetical protein
MSDKPRNDLTHQIMESLIQAYARESPAMQRKRALDAYQREIAGSGEWDDPFGRPGPAGCRPQRRKTEKENS